MTFFNGSLEVKHITGYWTRPCFYRPTCLHRHAFAVGPFVVFWRKDYSNL